jgi:copper transport protein
MKRIALLVAAVVALALPASAAAHATLVSSVPGRQAKIDEPPTTVVLRFGEPLTITSRAVLVLAPGGAAMSGTPRLSADRKVVTTPVSGLAKGEGYTVRWRVTGVDGHSPAGVFTFGVGVRAPPPTDAVGASGSSWRDDVARWLLFLSIALVLGPLTVRLLVLRGAVPPSLEHRFHLVTTVAAFAVIDVGIAAFVVRASNALQLPIVDLLYGDLTPFAEKTRFGVAFLAMTAGFAVVAALLMLAWIFDRSALRWLALGLAIALVSGLSLSGHQGTEWNAGKLSELADWLHLVAAGVWVGGVATLALIVWPLAPDLRRRAFVGFSRLAVGLVGVLVVAGIYLALVRLPRLADLWETGYGQVLLLKSAIVAVALVWGGVHHTFVRPRLEAGGQPRVRASLVGETAVAIGVLLAAAMLTNASPPPPEQAPAATARSTR